MKTHRRFSFLTSTLASFAVSAVCCATLAACGVSHAAAPPIDIGVVMRAVHDYGKGQPAASAVPATNPVVPFAAASDPYNTDENYKGHIAMLFVQHDYASLEKEIAAARATKARLQGGIWKVDMFYDAVGHAIPAPPNFATVDWDAHLAEVKKWIAAYPESAAAHITLADTYTNYAWEARGNGYADTVSNSGWKNFEQRIQFAEAALLEAAKLKEKCPYWYEAMQSVALAQGWDREQAKALFDEATAFEPTDYHYYRQYANYLTPKWYGDEGETQKFAEESAKRLAEPESSIVYFEIESMLACPCDEASNTMDTDSWPKIKQGYQTIEKLYGRSRLKTNRFAYMSVVANDKDSARTAFDQIGDDWYYKYWIDPRYFQKAKDWATAP
jgi:uncharacterized protein DUF4034